MSWPGFGSLAETSWDVRDIFYVLNILGVYDVSLISWYIALSGLHSFSVSLSIKLLIIHNVL